MEALLTAIGRSKCNICDIVKRSLSIIFTVVMTAAIIGAYEAVLGEKSIAGSMEASLSILALILTLMLWTTNLDCSGCPNPRYQQCIVFAFLILTTIASLIGLFRAHFTEEGLILGTVQGSLSILTFAIVATYWAKHVQTLCESCVISCPTKE